MEVLEGALRLYKAEEIAMSFNGGKVCVRVCVYVCACACVCACVCACAFVCIGLRKLRRRRQGWKSATAKQAACVWIDPSHRHRHHHQDATVLLHLLRAAAASPAGSEGGGSAEVSSLSRIKCVYFERDNVFGWSAVCWSLACSRRPLISIYGRHLSLPTISCRLAVEWVYFDTQQKWPLALNPKP